MFRQTFFKLSPGFKVRNCCSVCLILHPPMSSLSALSSFKVQASSQFSRDKRSFQGLCIRHRRDQREAVGVHSFHFRWARHVLLHMLIVRVAVLVRTQKKQFRMYSTTPTPHSVVATATPDIDIDCCFSVDFLTSYNGRARNPSRRLQLDHPKSCLASSRHLRVQVESCGIIEMGLM